MGDMVDVLFDLSNDESTREEDDDDNSTCSMIRVSKQDKLQIRESRYTLILKVLGHSIGFAFLHRRLKKIWHIMAAFEVLDLSHGLFLAKFTNRDDYDLAYFGALWSIANHYLLLREWQPNFLSYSCCLQFSNGLGKDTRAAGRIF